MRSILTVTLECFAELFKAWKRNSEIANAS